MTSQRLAPTPKLRAAAKAKASSVEPKAPVPTPKNPPKAPPGLTDEPVVDLPRSVLLFNPATFGRCKRSVLKGRYGKIIIFDFHNVIDRYFWSPRAGEWKTQYKIVYPDNARRTSRRYSIAAEAGASGRSRSWSAGCYLLPYMGKFQKHRRVGFGHPEEHFLHSQLANAKQLWW